MKEKQKNHKEHMTRNLPFEQLKGSNLHDKHICEKMSMRGKEDKLLKKLILELIKEFE